MSLTALFHPKKKPIAMMNEKNNHVGSTRSFAHTIRALTQTRTGAQLWQAMWSFVESALYEVFDVQTTATHKMLMCSATAGQGKRVSGQTHISNAAHNNSTMGRGAVMLRGFGRAAV